LKSNTHEKRGYRKVDPPAAASVTIFTTGEVLTEVLAFCSADEGLRARAAKAVRSILTALTVNVLPQSHETFLEELYLYESRPDKGYSLTDAFPCRRCGGRD
jgi:hypothetical protein